LTSYQGCMTTESVIATNLKYKKIVKNI
jgi:hypothetical protein